MGTQIEEAALAYAAATQNVEVARAELHAFKRDLERANYSAPILGRRFQIAGKLKEALLIDVCAALSTAIERQVDSARALDAAAGIKPPSMERT